MTVFDLEQHCRQLNQTEISSLHTVLALGTFDGVHKGHAALLRAAAAIAADLSQDGTPVFPAVWTFSDAPDRSMAALSSLSDKLALFASHGIRYAFTTSFAAVRSMEAAMFVREMLLGTCGARAAVCGFNFRFGCRASGTPTLLSDIFTEHGAAVTVIDAVLLDGTPVSSTRIRSLLADGDTMGAAACLGRWYSFSLPVVHGKELGRTLGTPTINQVLPAYLQSPAIGTYATAVSVDGVLYPAVTNVGIRPSISENDNHRPNAETHIIGYRGWLYDRTVRVYFRHRLRDEMKFPSLDALKEQIHRDITQSAATFDQTAKELCHV